MYGVCARNVPSDQGAKCVCRMPRGNRFKSFVQLQLRSVPLWDIQPVQFVRVHWVCTRIFFTITVDAVPAMRCGDVQRQRQQLGLCELCCRAIHKRHNSRMQDMPYRQL